MRFYLPEILHARTGAPKHLLLLDDDVIVNKDVLELIDGGKAELLVPQGKALGAGCSHWAKVNNAEMSYSSDMSYLEVPYFGFGVISSASRPLQQATCHRPGQPACLPPGLLQRLGEVAENIDAALSGSFVRRAWRQTVAFAQDYVLPVHSVYRPPAEDAAPAPFADAMAQARAWNFGFTLVDLDAWAEQQLTRK